MKTSVLKRIWKSVGKQRLPFILSLITSAVFVCCSLYLPILFGEATDLIVEEGKVDLNGILKIGVSASICALIAGLAQWITDILCGKIANGITDTPVTMAAKAHLRNGKPLIIALATNDAMSANFKNIATMLEKKNVYFVPLVQDDPAGKPSSLVADFEKIEETVEYASRGIQIRPLFL